MIYMDGHGLMSRTRELNNAVWDALTPQMIIVPPVLFIGTVLSTLLLVRSLWFAPVPGAFLIISLFVADRMTAPWRNAMRELRTHREAMENETKRLGKGWAHS